MYYSFVSSLCLAMQKVHLTPNLYFMQKAQEKLQRYPSLIQAAEQAGTTDAIVQESVSTKLNSYTVLI